MRSVRAARPSARASAAAWRSLPAAPSLIAQQDGGGDEAVMAAA
jgi:hypothetical protein